MIQFIKSIIYITKKYLDKIMRQFIKTNFFPINWKDSKYLVIILLNEYIRYMQNIIKYNVLTNK